MRALKMNWKQLREEANPNSEFILLEGCVVVKKSMSIIREDFEHIEPVDDDNDILYWSHKNKVVAIFEVYPDEDAYTKRVIPITIFKHSFDVDDDVNDYEKSLWEDLKSKKDAVQDFSKSELINLK